MARKYRFDERNQAEFERDIKNHTMEERALFLLWLDLMEEETGSRPEFQDIGCGKNGDFLEDHEVNTNPDFKVEGYGELEVKFAKPLLKRSFHLKKNQVKQYHKRGASILMVNGASEDIPMYTLLKTDALAAIMEDCDIVSWRGFGGKPAYRIPIKKFIWRPLKNVQEGTS
jgi:hypothetical protein